MNLKLSLTLITVIFCLALLYSCYQEFKADYQAVKSLEEYCESCREYKPGGNLGGGAG